MKAVSARIRSKPARISSATSAWAARRSTNGTVVVISGVLPYGRPYWQAVLAGSVQGAGRGSSQQLQSVQGGLTRAVQQRGQRQAEEARRVLALGERGVHAIHGRRIIHLQSQRQREQLAAGVKVERHAGPQRFPLRQLDRGAARRDAVVLTVPHLDGGQLVHPGRVEPPPCLAPPRMRP